MTSDAAAPYDPNAEMSDGFAGAAQSGPPMKTDDLIKIEHYRRFLRPDWRRLPPPDPERGLTREQIKAQRHDFMLRDLAFETPLARRLRKEQEAREREEQERLEAAQTREIEHEALKLKADIAWERFKAAFMRGDFKANFNPNQPRVAAGNADGGQWASAGEGGGQSLEQQSPGLRTAAGQEQRGDQSQLEAITNHPSIRSRIDEAWGASNPSGPSPRKHGFWISRNENTGELFTRPFTNPGSAARITPGPTPGDAIAFFHTHPNLQGYGAGPSIGDRAFAADVGLPGVLQSHNGIYYFGPRLRPPGR